MSIKKIMNNDFPRLRRTKITASIVDSILFTVTSHNFSYSFFIVQINTNFYKNAMLYVILQ